MKYDNILPLDPKDCPLEIESPEQQAILDHGNRIAILEGANKAILEDSKALLDAYTALWDANTALCKRLEKLERGK